MYLVVRPDLEVRGEVVPHRVHQGEGAGGVGQKGAPIPGAHRLPHANKKNVGPSTASNFSFSRLAVSHQEAHAEGSPRPGGGLVLVHPGVVVVRPPQVLQESRVHDEYVHVGRYNEVRVGHEG